MGIFNNENLNTASLILAKVRGGDYNHAGEEDAINLMLQKIASVGLMSENETILDVGCGLGGTADYIYKLGFKNIFGTDISEPMIDYATNKYPHIEFKAGNMLDVEQNYPRNYFSIIYLMNSIFAIENKGKLLQVLKNIAAKNGLLVIFEYAYDPEKGEYKMLDFFNRPMYPIDISNFPQLLAETGWELLELEDISNNFIDWYSNLLMKLDDYKNNAISEFTKEEIDKVIHVMSSVLNQFKNKEISGALIVAIKR